MAIYSKISTEKNVFEGRNQDLGIKKPIEPRPENEKVHRIRPGNEEPYSEGESLEPKYIPFEP